MKRLGVLLLAGGLMAGVFLITGCTTAGGGASTSRMLITGQETGVGNQALFGDRRDVTGPVSEKMRQEERMEPQLEPFDKVCEESIKEFYLRLAQETEPQLEPFDKAWEESIKEFYLRLVQERVRIDREFTLVK